MVNPAWNTHNPVLAALLQHNFFPQQREDREELPPMFTTESFSETTANALVKGTEFSKRQRGGYDVVEYRMTRFDGAVRSFSIPHPAPYANLALSISNNWRRLNYITQNRHSKIIPELHSDGRIIIMDYEDRPSRAKEMLALSFGRRYVVRADISSCFPSIYTHSIPWALEGIQTAKQNRSKSRLWYNHIDKALQHSKRNETNGVAIGPATSNIVSEIILARVDEQLAKDFTHVRYIDDYTAYCESREKAEEFVLRLTEELAKYKLMLNSAKTQIKSLPQMSADTWLIALGSARPQSDDISTHDAVNYLDFAVELAEKEPDGSVLKYALKTLTSIVMRSQNTDSAVIKIVLIYALNLSFYHAALVPILEIWLDKAYTLDRGFQYGDELTKLIRHHTQLRHSDAMCWLLYLANKYGVFIEDDCSSDILYLSDDLVHQYRVVRFVIQLIQNHVDPYELDQYWLLLYQLFLDNRISDPYSQIGSQQIANTSFDILKNDGVSFVVPSPPLPPLPVIV